MSIIQFLGRSIKDYIEGSEKRIKDLITGGSILCELCLQPMKRHSRYKRGIKETGEELTITVVWCRACKKWHALLPDFILWRKHYSGNEIESVLIDSESAPISKIETEASEPTVRRWIEQIGEKVKHAVSVLKYHFGCAGKAISEIAITPGTSYGELEQVLELAPAAIKCSGNKLGLANLWLGTSDTKAYI